MNDTTTAGYKPDYLIQLHYKWSRTGILNSIAYQNSFIGGGAVLGARSLLDLLIEEPEIPLNRFEDTDIIENNIKVMPNPAYSSIEISFNLSATDIQVIDINGKILKSFALDGLHFSKINVADLSAGIYIIKILNQSEITGVTRFAKIQ